MSETKEVYTCLNCGDQTCNSLALNEVIELQKKCDDYESLISEIQNSTHDSYIIDLIEKHKTKPDEET